MRSRSQRSFSNLWAPPCDVSVQCSQQWHLLSWYFLALYYSSSWRWAFALSTSTLDYLITAFQCWACLGRGQQPPSSPSLSLFPIKGYSFSGFDGLVIFLIYLNIYFPCELLILLLLRLLMSVSFAFSVINLWDFLIFLADFSSFHLFYTGTYFHGDLVLALGIYL